MKRDRFQGRWNDADASTCATVAAKLTDGGERDPDPYNANIEGKISQEGSEVLNTLIGMFNCSFLTR